MKLRKTIATKVKNPKTKKVTSRPTSYHEISIPDVYIDKCKWNAGDTLSCTASQIGDGENVLIIRNVDKQSMTMNFFTGMK